jgi:hypothetical protein
MVTGARGGNTCASCEKFDLAASVGAGGRATCTIFEKPAEWSDRACVLHDAAKDVRQRKTLVLQLMESEKLTKEAKDGQERTNQA